MIHCTLFAVHIGSLSYMTSKYDDTPGDDSKHILFDARLNWRAFDIDISVTFML